MNRCLRSIVLAVVAFALGCSGNGAPQYKGGPSDAQVTFGNCAFCHLDKAQNLLPAGASLKCENCHTDLTPGSVGQGHRSIPGPDIVPSFVGPSHHLGAEAAFGACGFCHNDTAVALTPMSSQLNCQSCHADQAPGHYGPGHQSRPGSSVVPSPPSATHQPGAETIFGVCAQCHNQMGLDLLPNANELQCQTCHSQLLPNYGPRHQSRPGTNTVPSPAQSAHNAGVQSVFGSCALCHNSVATYLTPTSAELRCPACHAARAPTYGPGHQSRPGTSDVPSPPAAAHRPGAEAVFGVCVQCHNQMGLDLLPNAGALQCQTCHAQLLSDFVPQHQSLPGTNTVPSPAQPAHNAGAESAFGSCALCHNSVATKLTPTSAELRCPACHTAQAPTYGPGHQSLPGPDQVPSSTMPAHELGAAAQLGTCGYCHNDVALNALQFGTHGDLSLQCASCHVAQEPAGTFGAMHQRVPACAECHGTERQTHHDPEAGTNRECAVCHTPHGSANLFLIRELMRTPDGRSRPVQFDNVRGVADGGFVSVSEPGSGLCETCHTQTAFYRGDGSGKMHFPYTCFTCHSHTLGFSPTPVF
jgi:predicted CXXCH cytochrome family protein